MDSRRVSEGATRSAAIEWCSFYRIVPHVRRQLLPAWLYLLHPCSRVLNRDIPLFLNIIATSKADPSYSASIVCLRMMNF